MILISHQTGNRNVRGLLSAAHKKHLLDQFFVTLSLGDVSWARHLLPERLVAELARREFSDVPNELISTHPAKEVAAIALERIPFVRNLRLTRRYRSIGFLRSHDRWVANRLDAFSASRIFYGYPCGALESFAVARSAGMKCALEYTQAHWSYVEAMLQEERDLRPQWSSSLPTSEMIRERAAREDEELGTADLLIVPSRFVERTLPNSTTRRLLMSYGCPRVTRPRKTWRKSTQPLRVLYVGSLSQQKGLSYLFDAVRHLGNAVALTIVGRPLNQDCRALAEELARHRWIPSLPNQAVQALMYEHDVLVLPSLSEAYGLVVGEALSQGTPVIVSSNVGAADLITSGRDGFVVAIRDPEAIAAALEKLLSRVTLTEMSANARKTASANPEALNWPAVVEWLAQEAP